MEITAVLEVKETTVRTIIMILIINTIVQPLQCKDKIADREITNEEVIYFLTFKIT
jgi:hypothetical protein